MEIELPEWIKRLERSERNAFTENGEEWFASTVRKKKSEDIGKTVREAYRIINGCRLRRYRFPRSGTVIQDQIQAKRRRNSEEVLFLVLEKGSGENWDTLEDTVWTHREMEEYLIYLSLLQL